MRPSVRAWSSFGVALTLSAVLAGNARANGRFPNAHHVRELGPGRLGLAGTYGLLLTTNSGSDWYLVCEPLLFGRAAPGWQIDPLFELAGGAIVSGSPHAVRVSRDAGCTWQTDASLPVDPGFFSDEVAVNDVGLTIDLTPVPEHGAEALLALVAVTDSAGLVVEHRLYMTVDGAASWRPHGAAIPRSSGYPLFTVDVAPSTAERVYVSGMAGASPVMIASADGARTWTVEAIAVDGADGARGAYIAGVSAADADRVYVRIPRWTEDASGSLFWDDSLLVSADGGRTFADVLRRRGNLLGFALSPDGAAVLAGFGDPKMASVLSQPSEIGLYRASTGDHEFQQIVGEVAVSCLRWTANGIYACVSEQDPLGLDPNLADDFHLGLYSGSGLPARRADFVPLLKLRDVRGVLPWSDGRLSECTSDWCSSLPVCPSGGSEAASAPGAQICLAGSAGADEPAEPRESSCACSTAAARGPAHIGLGLLALLGIWRRRRS